MMRTRKIHEPVTDPERAAARDALARIRDGGALCVQAKTSNHALPAFIAREVVSLLEGFAEGHTPMVSISGEEVGTQQAADFLKLSRPTVVKMMDDGRIPFRRPGKHRRVRLADLVAFEAQLRRDRETAIDELSTLGQEAIRQARDNGSFSDEMI
jgi:excisionase family DNA binding protein